MVENFTSQIHDYRFKSHSTPLIDWSVCKKFSWQRLRGSLTEGLFTIVSTIFNLLPSWTHSPSTKLSLLQNIVSFEPASRLNMVLCFLAISLWGFYLWVDIWRKGKKKNFQRQNWVTRYSRVNNELKWQRNILTYY